MTACGDATAPVVDPVGIFGLSRVDTTTLPATLGPTAASGPWYIRGTLELRANGSYTQTVTDSNRTTGIGTVVEVGTWARFAGDSIRFTATTAGREPGTGLVTTGELSRRQFARVFIYRRP